jgi:hypothetical protein
MKIELVPEPQWTTTVDDKLYTSGNSQLLIDYRTHLIRAFELGEEIKALYNIVPPKVITKVAFDGPSYSTVVIGLTVN